MDTSSSPSSRIKLKSTNWLWLIFALIIIGGSIAYINHKNNKTNSSINSKKPYALAANIDMPMLVTINTRAQGDKTGNIAVLQSDGKGNYKYVIFANGKPFNTTVYTPDAIYACKNFSTPCLKYPKDTSSHDFQPTNFSYTPSIISKIRALKSTTYQGQQACPVGGGTCDVWTYSINVDTKTDYVNTATKKLVAISEKGYFGKTEITTKTTYQYKDQHITLPTDYQNAPAAAQ